MLVTAESKKSFVNEVKKLFEGFQTSFVAIRGYRNDKGEVSDYVINVGINHNKVLVGDLNRLPKIKAEHFLLYSEKYGDNIALQAFNEKQISIEKSLAGTNVHANGQIEAYAYIGQGVKVHLETGDIFITGYLVSKKVHVKGVYPTVKSRPLTLCKKAIDKHLKANKCRVFKISFDKLAEVQTGGKTIEFALAA
jgi:hypothetical protein